MSMKSSTKKNVPREVEESKLGCFTDNKFGSCLFNKIEVRAHFISDVTLYLDKISYIDLMLLYSLNSIKVFNIFCPFLQYF